MNKTYSIDKVGVGLFKATIIYEHYRGMAGLTSIEQKPLFLGSISDCMAIIEADKRGYLTENALEMAYQSE